MKSQKVAIIGLGTVGSGLAQILLNKDQRVDRYLVAPIELARVVVRDKGKSRDCNVPVEIVSEDVKDVLADEDIKIVAQLIGGTDTARTIMLQLLEGGKDVVTANKALLAEHGPELFNRARELGRSIAFEAAVAGGIPIIANISQCLTGNQITSLRGILNGTCNFIVSQMEEGGRSYADALAQAQQLGYAEADPTMDVDGTDAAQKLAILAQLAFRANVHWADIPRQGIASLDSIDMKCAAEMGYRIRLLAVAELRDEKLDLHVSPTLVRNGTPLSEVRGAFNAVSVVGDAVGPVFFQGQGAGQMPTASAVAADVIDTAVGRAAITFNSLDLWSAKRPQIELNDPNQTTSRFYLRVLVRDQPGVLAEVAFSLANQGVSIASIIQHEAAEAPQGGSTPIVSLVIMTHSAKFGSISKAVAKIDSLDASTGTTVCMRVLE
ncbi:MAG: homoserine dehydrogenase [Rubripirellula sp.]